MLGLGRFGGRSHRRIPIEQAAATIARQQFAFAKLVPHLGSDTHAAAGALLVFRARQAGAARAGETVKADQRLRLNQRAQSVAFGVERGQFGGKLALAEGDADAGLVECPGQQLNLGAGGCQHGFVRIGALQARKLLIFQAIGFRSLEGDLMLYCGRLLWSLYGIELGAEADCFLAVSRDLAFQAGAQRFLAIERVGGGGRLAFGGVERGFGVGDFGGQRAQGKGEASALQVNSLQLHEIFNVRLHPVSKVYGIGRPIRKSAPMPFAGTGRAKAKFPRVDCIQPIEGGWRRRQSDSGKMKADREAGLVENRASFWRRNQWLWWFGGGLLAAAAVLAVWVAVVLHRIEPYLRAQIVEELSQHFHARVELDGLHVALRNGLWAKGEGLRIWPPAEVAGVNVPGPASTGEPLIRLAEFRFQAPLHFEKGKPFRISVVQLQGLDIHVPPRSHFDHVIAGPGETKNRWQWSGVDLVSFSMDTVECSGVRLVLESSQAGKQPQQVAIEYLKLTGVSAGGAMGFDAELTNPRPVGTVHTTGSFGPWLVSDPGESPVAGVYRFDHADLSDFKQIAGILSSTGQYAGTLRHLTVDGETDTPDFRLEPFNNPLALHTHFHARVDGTNGDTWLEPVDATLGNSHFTAQGQIVRVTEAGQNGALVSKGHDIALTVNVDRARLEDFMRLASRSAKPMLTGALTATSTLHIPPGAQKVVERLRLNGRFHLNQARFASAAVQGKIEQLSLRGQGRPGDLKTADAADAAAIDSTMEGEFKMASGVITMSSLEYRVPGATIDLKGAYGVEGGALGFTGTARLQATVSEMVGGWKGLLLKPADRFFKKNGVGTEVPIHIDGTRENPQFGVDFGKMSVHSSNQPEEKPR